MDDVWKVLAGNLAAVALIVSIWTHLSYRFYQLPPKLRCAGLGVAMGLAAIASMLLSVRFDVGVIFDLRLAIIESAAVFGGPGPALITAILAACFRLYLGGAGVTPGLTAIAIVFVLGSALWFFAGRKPMSHAPSILSAAVLAGCLSIAVLALLPAADFQRAVDEVGLPIAVLNFATTAAIGFFLAYFRRFTLERDILYAALTQAPDYHYVKDLKHRFVVANLNVARHNGRARSSEMVGLTDHDLAPKERAEQLMAVKADVMRTGQPLDHFEEFLIEEGKPPRWYSTSKVPLKNRQGDMVGLAGVTVDITEKKLLEQELRSSRNIMAQAMAEMSDGLAMFGPDGNIVFCNERYRELFPKSAYARKEGAHITDIVRATVRNGERKDLPIDLDEESIQAAAKTLFINKDEVIPLADGRWLSLRTRVTEDRHVLALVSDITAMKESELSLKSFAEQMKGLAETDALTGLSNRRSFDDGLQREFEAAKQTGRPLSVLLIDVDRFKAYNDRYGHLPGDVCLKSVAAAIATGVRRSGDITARFGGEEFAVLLPDTDGDMAIAIAEKIRTSIRKLSILHEDSEYGIVTVSVGATVFTPLASIGDPTELVERADLALYQAKNAGRNCVRFHRLADDYAKDFA
ncbi:diguanylate cyclase (GGDEF)-like protein/PAS domain S-box-containing protein [Rhizobium rosettiformans]|uniref:diguanylate cyclase n=2 Tax=Rhizobium rosettiformans TaxID=1368430 RepID=A0A4S8PLW7_9HYPH|nr:diguanylate cyclase [Rhizobium rosettiformans]MBB5278163.1 diguanylate cyclase (GGDEF)-like protein/PAS domain S-box-containing protein [Rhizobium rosettiformans]THV31883.1 diguanylate cyclase [Rhizobium rosettiformans W3]